MKNNKEEQQRMLRQLKKTELLELLIEENDENERLYRLLQEQSAGQADSFENAGEDSPAGADFSSVNSAGADSPGGRPFQRVTGSAVGPDRKRKSSLRIHFREKKEGFMLGETFSIRKT